jgi:spore coat protein H
VNKHTDSVHSLTGACHQTQVSRIAATFTLLSFIGCSSRTILNAGEGGVDSPAFSCVRACRPNDPPDASAHSPLDAGASQPSGSTRSDSSPTMDSSPAETSSPQSSGQETGAGEFKQEVVCEPAASACSCYVEAACERGDANCSGVAVWSLTVEQGEFEYINEHRHEDLRIPGTLCADSKLYELTVEVQGASSRRAPKKSYNLRFDERNELPGEYLGAEGTLDKLVIKAMASDRTLVRETLSFDLWRAMGHDAPYSGGLDGYIQLVINGQFHGVYARVEPVDKDYMRRRNMRDDGRLYKGVRKNGGFADFRPGRVLEDAFEERTDPDHPNYEPLQALVDVIQDEGLTPQQFVEEIDKRISVELLMDRIIWVSFTQNGDAKAQNFFLYYTPQESRPWHLVPWDSNSCFGADWADHESFLAADAVYLLGGNLLAERLLEYPAFVEAFERRYLDLLDTLFTSEALHAELAPLVDYLSIAMDRDRELWGYDTDALTAFEGLANFLTERPLAIKDKLSLWP